MENQLFNFKKIKEITTPVEILQGNLFRLESIYKEYIENKDDAIKNFSDQDFINQIQELNQLLKNINDTLIKVSKENIGKFIFFQDELIKKYKDDFVDKLKKSNLNRNNIKQIGLNLIENKKISKIIYQSSFLFSLTLDEWLDLLDSLKQNSLYLATLKKVEKYYSELLKKRLKQELSKIPNNSDPNLIKDFEKSFHSNPITFKEFIQNIESKSTQKELETKRRFIEKTKEDASLTILKEKQERQLQSFEDYFKFSDKEFKRRMRKKKREKLSNIVENPNKNKKIEISEEVSEKIEKFKSKFENNFEEKFLIKKDDEIDPLDLIRKRKEMKDKEYKEFVKKFEDKEN
ncbi:MAG: hypothetical protein EU529_07175 [Promethearchaeota archaeon]|nr:MAG: hypothetical protein EU529_07175 [Candidatus Lokiarchaeota archaeon]